MISRRAAKRKARKRGRWGGYASSPRLRFALAPTVDAGRPGPRGGAGRPTIAPVPPGTAPMPTLLFCILSVAAPAADTPSGDAVIRGKVGDDEIVVITTSRL